MQLPSAESTRPIRLYKVRTSRAESTRAATCRRSASAGARHRLHPPGASVIDAFSYNMKVSVVEECVFDRGQASHKINLFDMAMKYADVISLKETIDYIRGLPDNLYAPAL